MLQTRLITSLTEKICEFWRKHPDAYVWKVDTFTEGTAVPLGSFLFEIIDENENNVGFLMVVRKEAEIITAYHKDCKYEYEVELGIFDHPTVKRSYAKECLQNLDCLVLSKVNERLPVVALVRHKNKQKLKMQQILLDSNFVKIDEPIQEGILYALK